MAVHLGVDPGLNGALALFNDRTGALICHDMPRFTLERNGKKKGEIDQVGLAHLLRGFPPVDKCLIEQVNAMPKDGPVSAFAFGKAYGSVIAAVAALDIPTEFIPPSAWKRAMRVTDDKDSSRHRASQLSPKHAGQWARKMDDGRAEAGLLAMYCATRGTATAPAPPPPPAPPPLPVLAADDGIGMNDRQRHALGALAKRRGTWTTAHALGSRTPSLRALVRRGLAEEKYGGNREAMTFRITEDGRDADKFLKELGL